MRTNGKEYRFLGGVGARCDIAEKLTPDGNAAGLAEALYGADYGKVYKNRMTFIRALNKCYEESIHQNDEEPLSVISWRTMRSLKPEDFDKLFEEAANAFIEDGKPTVEAEEEKGKNGEEESG